MAISKEKERRLRERATKEKELNAEREKEIKRVSDAKVKADKAIALEKEKAEAKLAKQKPEPISFERLVRNDRVEQFKANGWKVKQDDVRDAQGKQMDSGVRTHASDLTLMVKKGK